MTPHRPNPPFRFEPLEDRRLLTGYTPAPADFHATGPAFGPVVVVVEIVPRVETRGNVHTEGFSGYAPAHALDVIRVEFGSPGQSAYWGSPGVNAAVSNEATFSLPILTNWQSQTPALQVRISDGGPDGPPALEGAGSNAIGGGNPQGARENANPANPATLTPAATPGFTAVAGIIAFPSNATATTAPTTAAAGSQPGTNSPLATTSPALPTAPQAPKVAAPASPLSLTPEFLLDAALATVAQPSAARAPVPAIARGLFDALLRSADARAQETDQRPDDDQGQALSALPAAGSVEPITRFSPFDRVSVAEAIDRFLDGLDPAKADEPMGLTWSSDVLAEVAAAALAVTTLRVVLRARARSTADETAAALASEIRRLDVSSGLPFPVGRAEP